MVCLTVSKIQVKKKKPETEKQRGILALEVTDLADVPYSIKTMQGYENNWREIGPLKAKFTFFFAGKKKIAFYLFFLRSLQSLPHIISRSQVQCLTRR